MAEKPPIKPSSLPECATSSTGDFMPGHLLRDIGR
jgi:hypothetical protein